MAAEYVALSMAMRDLTFQTTDLIQFYRCRFDKDQQFNILCNVFEYNAGTLALAKLELPWMTPQSKHYSVKYHWFWSCLKPENIQVLKIESKQKLADLFTKGLVKSTFEFKSC